MGYRKQLIVLHTVLAAFFLPMGIMYAITGAEQLGLQQLWRQRAAVHADQRLVFARAVVVDGLGNEFFAAAGLAEDQTGGSRRRDLCDRAKHIEHRRARPDDVVEGVSLAEVVGELLFLFEPLIALQADLLMDADGLRDQPGEDF